MTKMSITLIELQLTRKNRYAKLAELVNQYMAPFAIGFEVHLHEAYKVGYNVALCMRLVKEM
uniref:Uncharacterized protein n=1 Tax=Salix viminalis TaxID=40686 RepID=A0A6N2LZP7_SALVM